MIANRMVTGGIVFSAVMALCSASALARPDIKPDAPPKDGTMNLTVTKLDGTVVPVAVPVTREGSDDDARKLNKAEQIQNALSAAGVNASVNATGNVDVSAKSVALGKNTTGEVDKVVGLGGLPGGAAVATLGWGGEINSIGVGGEPVYSAYLGWQGFEIATTIPHANLTEATIGGLLTQIYNDWHAALPAPHQSNLSLDLANSQIQFQYPSGTIDPMVGGGSLSEFSWPTMSVSEVPEPSTMALVTAIAPAVLRRRRA